MNKKLILTGFAIFISLIFLMAPIGAASHSISPATTSSTNYQPNPSLNTQATWSSFNSSMAYNEYINATGNPAYLNVENGTGNYITINPQDIQSKDLQGEKITNFGYENSSAILGDTGGNDVSYSISTSTENGEPIIITKAVSTNSTTAGWGSGAEYNIPIADYPSSNIAYDYITMIISSNITTAGPDAVISIFNSTGTQIYLKPSITNGVEFISMNLEQLENKYGIGLNTTAGKGYSSSIRIVDWLAIPADITGTYYTQIDGFAFTTYPITLGTNDTGAIITHGTGNIYLNNFKPTVPMAIINNGYSENLTQPMSLTNYTTTQTPITSGNYIEQVGYQATFSLPSSPDLSYSATNFTLPLSVPASQFKVLEVNGVSYVSSLGNKTNGTAVLLSSVNPTSTISYLAYVDYTATQWQSVSHPAGIFTVDGIEYYWFIAVGAIAGLLGLAGGVRHAHTKADQTEKVKGMGPKGR